MFKEVLKRQDVLNQELPEEKEFLKPEIVIEDLKPVKETIKPKPLKKKPKPKKKTTIKKKPAKKKITTTKKRVDKFMASETSARYHTAKCVWAKKIKPSARIYYHTSEQAEKAGHLPCRCTS